jgi:hypothetical protein
LTDALGVEKHMFCIPSSVLYGKLIKSFCCRLLLPSQRRIILEAETTHYLYGIPLDEYNPHLKSSVGPHSDRAKLLQAAKCHVIDKIGGLHFKAFDCADRFMRGCTGCQNRVWGGRMLVTVGLYDDPTSKPPHI